MKKNTSIAYLAGIVDGEGTITLQSRDNTHQPSLAIANNHKPMLVWCANLVGLPFVICSKKKRKKHHKQSWVLQWRGSHALAVIEKIEPYLIVKRKHAECVLSWRNVVKRNGKYTTRQRIKRDAVVRKIRKLNSRPTPTS